MPSRQVSNLSSVDRCVFINCPFDDEYNSFFVAIVFTTIACGFTPRCTKEANDSGITRIRRILHIIEESRFSVHDISRTELDVANNLPRFNMPFELGLFLGARHFDTKYILNRQCIVFDKEKYRFQKFLSDIGGQDISDHDDKIERLIEKLRDFYSTVKGQRVPSAKHINEDYKFFLVKLPTICEQIKLDHNSLNFIDLCHAIRLFYDEIGDA